MKRSKETFCIAMMLQTDQKEKGDQQLGCNVFREEIIELSRLARKITDKQDYCPDCSKAKYGKKKLETSQIGHPS